MYNVYTIDSFNNWAQSMKLEKAILAAGENVVFWNRPFGILIGQTELSFRLLHSLIKTTSSLTVVWGFIREMIFDKSIGFVHRLYIDYQCTIQHMYNEKIQTAIRPSVSEIS